MNQRKMSDYYYRYKNGLFGYIKTYLNVDWFTDDFAKSLNEIYFKNRSRYKTPSSVLDDEQISYVTTEDGYSIRNAILGNDVPTMLDRIAEGLVAKYGDKWINTWESLSIKYDLLDYYNETEVSTPKVTTTYDGKHNTDSKVSNTSNTSTTMYGFDGGTNGAKSNSIDVNGNTETTEGNDNNYYHNTISEDGTRTNTLDKKGGDVTERIKKYIELRKTTIVDIILSDIDEIITIPIYCI